MTAAPGDEAVWVALGASVAGPLGDPRRTLEWALGRLSDAGLDVVKRSRWWASRAWPDAADPPFLNGVALVRTALEPGAALKALHAIEAQAGRDRRARNGPRPLDLDLIAWGGLVQAGPPTLPHPRAAERRFVMGPLAELAPAWRHPVSGERADGLAARAVVGGDAEPLAP